MSTLLVIVADLVIGLGIFVMLVILGGLIYKGKTDVERLVRSFALLAGFLVFLSAKLLKISIPQLMYQAAEMGGLIASSIWAMLLPAIVGLAMSAFFASTLRRGGERQINTLIVVGTLVLCAFCDVFAAQVINDSTAKRLEAKMQRLSQDYESIQRNISDARSRVSSSSSEAENLTLNTMQRQEGALLHEIKEVERNRQSMILAEFGPNITFILSVLFYVIFFFDRRELARLLENEQGPETPHAPPRRAG